jgi:hypothetical protein
MKLRGEIGVYHLDDLYERLSKMRWGVKDRFLGVYIGRSGLDRKQIGTYG